ncbi:MAG: hypothetical protein QOE76_3380 [Frankiales bacterium]|jgi:hypothetical protein|nr:hypothetical protein [Frankiales bacterium]
MTVTVDFCGERHPVRPRTPFILGREGDIVIDDNPYLHRRFLAITDVEGMWWLTNVGSQLSATVADRDGRLQAWLAPGARLPLVFECTAVWFTAGPTTYELEILLDDPQFQHVVDEEQADIGQTTIGRPPLTPDQKLLLVALAEPVLRRRNRGGGAVPSSASAADRLGWTLTKFNRKLDNVCEKYGKSGVRGLHGGPAKLASNRRARLVEYVIAARIVGEADLDLLSP